MKRITASDNIEYVPSEALYKEIQETANLLKMKLGKYLDEWHDIYGGPQYMDAFTRRLYELTETAEDNVETSRKLLHNLNQLYQ